MSYIVYGLDDPRDGLYHYVGITNNIYRRFIEHLSGIAGNRKNEWIFDCKVSSVMIGMKELERVKTKELADYREAYWIKYYLSLGHPLCNVKLATSIHNGQKVVKARLAPKLYHNEYRRTTRKGENVYCLISNPLEYISSEEYHKLPPLI